jgi:hypothetical protein
MNPTSSTSVRAAAASARSRSWLNSHVRDLTPPDEADGRRRSCGVALSQETRVRALLPSKCNAGWLSASSRLAFFLCSGRSDPAADGTTDL